MLGCAVALFIMLLVPLTQIFQPAREKVEPIEAIELAAPPPPPPLEDPPPPPPKEEEPLPPELKVPRPMPTLEQLEVSLDPGTGDLSLGAGLGLAVDFSTESPDQLVQIFGFGELDELPQLLRRLKIRFPPNFPRRLKKGYVRLLIHIDIDGRVSVQKVIDYSHIEFVEPIKSAVIRSARYSPPMRNGVPVRSRYEWLIGIGEE